MTGSDSGSVVSVGTDSGGTVGTVVTGGALGSVAGTSGSAGMAEPAAPWHSTAPKAKAASHLPRFLPGAEDRVVFSGVSPNSGAGAITSGPGGVTSGAGAENSGPGGVISGTVSRHAGVLWNSMASYLVCTSTWGKGHSTPRRRNPSSSSRFKSRWVLYIFSSDTSATNRSTTAELSRLWTPR